MLASRLTARRRHCLEEFPGGRLVAPHLRHQRIYPIKRAIAPQELQQVNRQHLTVDVGIEVENICLDHPLTGVNSRSRTDIGHGHTRRRIIRQPGVTGIDAVPRHDHAIWRRHVCGRKSDLAPEVAAMHHFTGDPKRPPEQVLGGINRSFQNGPSNRAAADNFTIICQSLDRVDGKTELLANLAEPVDIPNPIAAEGKTFTDPELAQTRPLNERGHERLR